ncbi:molybdenum cofactor cytidylyltransferase [Anaerolineales bacterium]
MELKQAFDINKGDVISFIGAGGKTSTLVALAYEMIEDDWRVLATTTTRVGVDQLDLMPFSMQYDQNPDAVSEAISRYKFVFLYASIEGDKVLGLAPKTIKRLLDNIDSDILLIEADGARGLPCKALKAHEPVIPRETSIVIATVSMSAVGQPLEEAFIYNAQAMIDKFGFYPGTPVRSPWIAQVLRDEELGLKNIPPKARVYAYLNQTPYEGYLRNRARLVARLTLNSEQIYGVAIGSVRAAQPVYEIQRPVGAIILAAGASSRMGQPKVLLPWEHNTSIIEHIIEQLIRARVNHIVVVTGHYADEIKAVVRPLGVKVVFNRSYKTGEMLSSVKTGLRALPEHVSAALMVLGDQPRIQPKTVLHILDAYAQCKSDLIAPSFEMRRGHPILIGRRYWNEILALSRHQAPRDVINAHHEKIHYINVTTDSVLQDIDTPHDYQEARRKAGLPKLDIKPIR